VVTVFYPGLCSQYTKAPTPTPPKIPSDSDSTALVLPTLLAVIYQRKCLVCPDLSRLRSNIRYPNTCLTLTNVWRGVRGNVVFTNVARVTEMLYIIDDFDVIYVDLYQNFTFVGIRVTNIMKCFL
jgi:hypothetical protein